MLTLFKRLPRFACRRCSSNFALAFLVSSSRTDLQCLQTAHISPHISNALIVPAVPGRFNLETIPLNYEGLSLVNTKSPT